MQNSADISVLDFSDEVFAADIQFFQRKRRARRFHFIVNFSPAPHGGAHVQIVLAARIVRLFDEQNARVQRIIFYDKSAYLALLGLVVQIVHMRARQCDRIFDDFNRRFQSGKNFFRDARALDLVPVVV